MNPIANERGGGGKPGVHAQATIYIGIGSNLGDRARAIQLGLSRLEEMGAITVLKMSSLYETEPVGWEGGPWYLNAVAEGLTTLNPHHLLATFKEVEREAGRGESERNAPRTLDLDLLLYNGERIEESDLVVPHPRMLERAFVLWPLAEISPGVEIIPGLTAKSAMQQLTEHEKIRVTAQAPLSTS